MLAKPTRGVAPFDCAKLDELMTQSGIDVLLATSKPNIQYLMGGYRCSFFGSMDAIGISRYLPIFIYFRGRPDLAGYIGGDIESFDHANGAFWTPHVSVKVMNLSGAVQEAVDYVRSVGLPARTIGVEPGFLPMDAAAALGKALPSSELVDFVVGLERLRAVKSPAEIAMLREASDRVVQSMLATIAQIQPGMTKAEIIEQLRREETARGLNFEYCLLAVGRSFNRGTSDQVVEAGDVISIDSGGNFSGYIGDLARMAVVGEADAELEQLLGLVDAVQQAARGAVRAGAIGSSLYDAANACLAGIDHKMHFVAHGMGLIGHEAPRLSAKAPIPYPAYDSDLPLQSGMILSIETSLPHATRGFIKLEDTIVVTDSGYEALGDFARGWNVCGVATAN
jgi:Xaa-Pro aminopeptidase